MEPLPAVTKALAGIAVACLFATIAFLIITPHVSVGDADVNCGAPALWYLEDRHDQTADELSTVAIDAPLPSCKTEIDERLRYAALSAIAVAVCLGGAVFATYLQTRRLRKEWEADLRRSESGSGGARRSRRWRRRY